MTKIAAIAWVTVRDALRQKLAVNLLLFALLLILASFTISTLTFGEQYRIIADLALSSAQLFGTLIAVFLGAGLVAGEIQRRTLYPVLAKPVSRVQYLVGRYAGLLATLWLNLAVMALVSVGVLALYLGELAFLWTTPFAAAFAGLAAQLAVVASIAILFSSFTNATLAAIFGLALAVAGHFSREVFLYWRDIPFLRAIGLVLPNLGALDYKVAVVYKDALPAGQLGLSLLYAALYAAVALALASAVFARRDLR
jgi:ABC-type transport system involved in multi-copper enzyme maturation permease subunit